MEFLGKDQRSDAHTVQIGGQRLHFSAHVRQVPFTDLGHHNATALRANLESFERLCDLAQRIVCTVQAVEAARMILVVEPLRSEEVVKMSQGAKNLDSFVI